MTGTHPLDGWIRFRDRDLKPYSDGRTRPDLSAHWMHGEVFETRNRMKTSLMTPMFVASDPGNLQEVTEGVKCPTSIKLSGSATVAPVAAGDNEARGCTDSDSRAPAPSYQVQL